MGVPAAGGVFLPEPLSELLVCRVILSLEATAAAAREKGKTNKVKMCVFPYLHSLDYAYVKRGCGIPFIYYPAFIFVL